MIKKTIKVLGSALVCMFYTTTLHAETFLVDNPDDSGTGSLRAAIDLANANPGPDTIEFDAGLNGTIVLFSDLPQLTGDVEILGLGAEFITVSGNSSHRPFSISGGITVTITGLTIADGQADFGGGISNEGNLTVNVCVLSGNHAESSGGAIGNAGGSLMVNQSTLSGNTTGATGETAFGAGIANDATGTVTIIESTLSGNISSFSGGALDNLGTLSVLRSTLSSNSADFGAAIENAGGMLTVRNSTLSGNSAVEDGGGIDNLEGDAIVEFSTLTQNSAASGGGIANDGSVTIKNSLVVNSAGGGNCFNDAGGTFTAQGVNFATDDSCPGFSQTTQGGINLGPLTDNGGPTRTHALQTGSVAIDAAADCTWSDGSTPVTEDQRGQVRPQGNECDSGAFETFGAPSDLIFIDGFEGN